MLQSSPGEWDGTKGPRRCWTISLEQCRVDNKANHPTTGCYVGTSHTAPCRCWWYLHQSPHTKLSNLRSIEWYWEVLSSHFPVRFFLQCKIVFNNVIIVRHFRFCVQLQVKFKIWSWSHGLLRFLWNFPQNKLAQCGNYVKNTYKS